MATCCTCGRRLTSSRCRSSGGKSVASTHAPRLRFRLLIARRVPATITAQFLRAQQVMALPSLPVLAGDKDQLLQQALARLEASARPGRPDQADPIVTTSRRLPAVAASYAPFPDTTDPRLRAALAARGIEQLYTHQADAFAHVLARQNVVTITPTASGKTLCYNAPVLDAILKNPST